MRRSIAGALCLLVAAVAYAAQPEIKYTERVNAATGEVSRGPSVANEILVAGYAAWDAQTILAPYMFDATTSFGDDVGIIPEAVGQVMEGIDFTLGVLDSGSTSVAPLSSADIIVDVYDANGFDINTSTPLISLTYEYRPAPGEELLLGEAIAVSFFGLEEENILLPAGLVVNFTYQNVIGADDNGLNLAGCLMSADAYIGTGDDYMYFDGIGYSYPYGGSPYGNVMLMVSYVDEDRDMAYKNVAEPEEGYAAFLMWDGAWVGDQLNLAYGGKLDTFSYSIANGGEPDDLATVELESCTAEITFFTFDANGEEATILGTISENVDFSLGRLEPGTVRFRTMENLQSENIILPAGTIGVKIRHINCVFTDQYGNPSSYVAELGQVYTDPEVPVVGSSPRTFFLNAPPYYGMYEFTTGPDVNFWYELIVGESVVAPDQETVYENTTSPVSGYTAPLGTWVGDGVSITKGGTLEAVSFSLWNDPDATSDLQSCSVEIEIYDLENDVTLATIPQTLDFSSSPLAPSYFVRPRIEGLASAYNITLDSRPILLSMRVVSQVGGGELGQIFFDPITIGDSGTSFYIDDTGATPPGTTQGFVGFDDFDGNFYWSVEVLDPTPLPAIVTTIPSVPGESATFEVSAVDNLGVGGVGVNLTTDQTLLYDFDVPVDFTYVSAPAGHVPLGWLFYTPNRADAPIRETSPLATGMIPADIAYAEAIYSVFVDFAATTNGAPRNVLLTIDTWDRNGASSGQTGTAGFTRHYDPIDFSDPDFGNLSVGVTAPAPAANETLKWIVERHDGAIVEVPDAGDGLALQSGFFPRTVAKVTAAYESPYAKADCNCDGAIDVFDIDPFVMALVDEAGYLATYPGCDRSNADVNNDGTVDVFDIDPFVVALVGNS